MENAKKNLANLLKVKTIVTLLLTVVFCVLALKGTISSSDFLTVFTVVIAFYFGTQSEKRAGTVIAAPTQGVTIPLLDNTEPVVNAALDSATVNEVHPPDQADVQEDTAIKGFAG